MDNDLFHIHLNEIQYQRSQKIEAEERKFTLND